MDFETLFQDLENQLERELDSELVNRLDDEERERRAKLTLRERLRELQRNRNEHVFTARTTVDRQIAFTITNVGKDWVALNVSDPADLAGPVICPLHVLNSIHIPAALVKESLGTPIGEISDYDLRELAGSARLAEKVNLAFVLRDISRRRKHVRIHTSRGIEMGTIDHVGVDHLDLTTTNSRQLMSLREIVFVQIV